MISVPKIGCRIILTWGHLVCVYICVRACACLCVRVCVCVCVCVSMCALYDPAT